VYRQALTVQDKLVTDFPDVLEYRAEQAANSLKLGGLLWLTGRLPEAEGPLRQGAAVYAELVTSFPTIYQYRRELARAHSRLARVMRGMGRLREAEESHRQALALNEQLAADFPSAAAYQEAIALTHITLGLVLVATGRHEEAEQGYRRALDLGRKLVAEFPAVPWYQSNLGAALDNYAESVLDRKGDPAVALRLVQEAIRHQRAALQLIPRHPTYRRFLGSHYAVLAETQLRRGAHPEAAAAATELSQLFPNDAQQCRQAAGFVARCVPLAENDPEQSESERQAVTQAYTSRALELLRTALQKGYRDMRQLNDAPDLAPLRRHDDFQKLLQQLEGKSNLRRSQLIF
jgi:tetratricopeptide (TPR) repeat protein